MQLKLGEAHKAAHDALELASHTSHKIISFSFTLRAGSVRLEEQYSVMQNGILRVATIDTVRLNRDGTRFVTGFVVDDAKEVAQYLPRATFLEAQLPHE